MGYLGRLEWYKGVHDLLESVAWLRRRGPMVQVDIAGDGPYRAVLEARAGELGIRGAVVFRGTVSGEAEEEWFRRVHVVATPSNQWENFPLVALEALARGRPVVGTNIGGIPDIVEEGSTGHLVPIARPDLLAGALEDLLADRERARAWGQEGRRRVLTRFAPELHVDRLLAVYREVLAGTSLRSGMEAQELLAA